MVQQNNNKKFASNKISHNLIIMIVIIVALSLTGLSVYLFQSFSSQIDIIKSNFFKFNEIDRFKLHFYRILAILRDVASGLY